MAINVNFNGSVIYKPGAYSKTTIDLGGNFPLGVTGIVGIIGEANGGQPGLLGPFRPDQMADLRSIYVSGNIVDAANFLFTPGADANIPSGANAIYIYKTNASTQASLALAPTYGTLRAIEFGTGGNSLSYTNVITEETVASVESAAAFDCGALADADSFSVAINGGLLNTFTIPATYTGTKADLEAALADGANWSNGLPVGLEFVVDGVDAAALLEIKMARAEDLASEYIGHTYGYSRNFVVRDGNNTPLVTMNITAGQVVPSVEPKANITITDTRTAISHSSLLGGTVAIKLGYYEAAATAAHVSVNANSVVLTVVGGASPGSTTITKSAYSSINQLVSYINTLPGWRAEAGTLATGNANPSVLSYVTAVGALKDANDNALYPCRIKNDGFVVKSFMDVSPFTIFEGNAASLIGLPNARTAIYLSGGSLASTNMASITAGFEAMTKFRLNAVVPLFSRDSTDDIADALTDAASVYSIEAINALAKSHVQFTAATKKKSERQAYVSYKGSYENSKVMAAQMAHERIQLFIQDIRQTDSLGNIKWFQPWGMACLVAGARCGSAIGLPMTFKYLNTVGIRHTGQPMTTAEADIIIDFDPDIEYDDAISSAITFAEAPQTGGFRVVLDNTTYNKDGNWVFNRGSVMYAMDIAVYDFRNQMENIYVGRKNNITVAEVSSTASSILSTYVQQGILVGEGFKNLVVRIIGNEIRITVTLVLVEGIEFILNDITIQRNVQ